MKKIQWRSKSRTKEETLLLYCKKVNRAKKKEPSNLSGHLTGLNSRSKRCDDHLGIAEVLLTTG